VVTKIESVSSLQAKLRPKETSSSLLNIKETRLLPTISSKKTFTRVVPFPVKVQSLSDKIDMKKAKRCKGMKKKRKKNHYQSQKIVPLVLPKVERKTLDGFLLLHSCHVKNPQQAIKSRLTGENIVDVEEGDLLFFPNLAYLNLSENKIRLEQLINLQSLTELHLQYNHIHSLHIIPGNFPLLEILSLGFNSIPAGHILQLAQLPNLRVLDLSGNELCVLPEELSSFTKLEELNLSSNSFSSDSIIIDPGKLFKSLSTIPHLKRLNLAHNMLKGFHFELLTDENVFEALAELDFSYNKVFNQENLLFCQKLKSLQAVIITGNPIGTTDDYKELEQIIYNTNSAVIVNHAVSPPNYLRKPKESKAEYYRKLPYPKPIASIIPSNSKAVIPKHIYETELRKGIAVTLGEIEPSKEEDAIFPEDTLQNREGNDIFTPPEAAERDKKFFLTENEGQMNYRVEEKKEVSSEEKVEELEDEYDSDYGMKRYTDFIEECREYIGNKKEYASVVPISNACKSLRHALKFPTIFVGSTANPHYMKSTLISTINKTLKAPSKAINFEELQCKFKD
jgi:Leucine-rich repeat (LRR) protein